MKKNAGKIVRLLVIAVIAAVIIGALSVMTSATDYTVSRRKVLSSEGHCSE